MLASGNLFLLLVADHLFHGVSLQLLGPLLNLNHFFVLSSFLLQTFRISVVLGSFVLFVGNDFVLLSFTEHSVTLCKFTLLSFALCLQSLLLLGQLLVADSNLHDILSLLLVLLNFLPSLHTQSIDR